MRKRFKEKVKAIKIPLDYVKNGDFIELKIDIKKLNLVEQDELLIILEEGILAYVDSSKELKFVKCSDFLRKILKMKFSGKRFRLNVHGMNVFINFNKQLHKDISDLLYDFSRVLYHNAVYNFESYSINKMIYNYVNILYNFELNKFDVSSLNQWLKYDTKKCTVELFKSIEASGIQDSFTPDFKCFSDPIKYHIRKGLKAICEPLRDHPYQYLNRSGGFVKKYDMEINLKIENLIKEKESISYFEERKMLKDKFKENDRRMFGIKFSLNTKKFKTKVEYLDYKINFESIKKTFFKNKKIKKEKEKKEKEKNEENTKNQKKFFNKIKQMTRK